eukprot:TRINITY_DN30261_c0_g1_i1.p2 TRINITY_DN30261_c0_g1~~TRINITY_DN30261_c0_g1_i1.p2  ORF type:complete len:245 (+),score=45.35 TRINITY_DN30261_c0_g1_i1:1579-2313(+)
MIRKSIVFVFVEVVSLNLKLEVQRGLQLPLLEFWLFGLFFARFSLLLLRAVLFPGKEEKTLYFIIALIGYVVYGTALSERETILETISKYPHLLRDTGKRMIMCAEILFMLHLLSVISIFLIPLFLTFETKFGEKSQLPDWKIYLLRTASFLVMLGLAILLPYFNDFLSLVSDISVSITIYVLPCLFYWNCVPTPFWEKCLLVLCITLSLVGSFTGLYVGTKTLIQDTNASFPGYFHFNSSCLS